MITCPYVRPRGILKTFQFQSDFLLEVYITRRKNCRNPKQISLTNVKVRWKEIHLNSLFCFVPEGIDPNIDPWGKWIWKSAKAVWKYASVNKIWQTRCSRSDLVFRTPLWSHSLCTMLNTTATHPNNNIIIRQPKPSHAMHAICAMWLNLTTWQTWLLYKDFFVWKAKLSSTK